MNWIPISERLPEHRGNVLVYCGDTTLGWYSPVGRWTILYWDAGIPKNIEDALSPPQITHWMPLPASPEDEK